MISVRELEFRINKLDTIKNYFSLIQTKIEELHDSLEAQYEEREQFEEEYFNIQAIAKQLLDQHMLHNEVEERNSTSSHKTQGLQGSVIITTCTITSNKVTKF